jgi:hypothetical protein
MKTSTNIGIFVAVTLGLCGIVTQVVAHDAYVARNDQNYKAPTETLNGKPTTAFVNIRPESDHITRTVNIEVRTSRRFYAQPYILGVDDGSGKWKQVKFCNFAFQVEGDCNRADVTVKSPDPLTQMVMNDVHRRLDLAVADAIKPEHRVPS